MNCWFVKKLTFISGIFENCSTSAWSYKMIWYSHTKPFQFLLMTKKLLVSQVQVSLLSKRYMLQSALILYWLCIWVKFTRFHLTTRIEDQFTKYDKLLVDMALWLFFCLIAKPYFQNFIYWNLCCIIKYVTTQSLWGLGRIMRDLKYDIYSLRNKERLFIRMS